MFLQYTILPFLGKAELFPFSSFTDLLIKVRVFPLITFFILLRRPSKNTNGLYNYSLISSGISFLLSLFLAGYISFAKNGFQDVVHFSLRPSFTFALRLGVDGISIFFILLTNFFIFLCIFSLSPNRARLHEALLYLFFLQ